MGKNYFDCHKGGTSEFRNATYSPLSTTNNSLYTHFVKIKRTALAYLQIIFMNSESHENLYKIAKLQLKKGNPAEAFLIYKRLAEAGDIQAKVYLGWMHDQGVGTERNQDKAYELFHAAASLGSIEGSFVCGKHLLGRERFQEALEYFNAQNLSTYGPALLWIGLMHVRGLGVPVDIPKGVMALKRAAKTGNFPARRELSLLMIKGELGFHRIPLGLILFVWALVSALITGLSDETSDKLMG